MSQNIVKPVLYGALASLILLGVYFAALTLVSGWPFAQSQFKQFWYFIVSLALGFGLQAGLYTYLKQAIRSHGSQGAGGAVAATGATSTLAMVSCCAHYLANIIPILGIAGALTIVAQYQTELFWVGIAFNVAGIAYITNKIIKYQRQHEAK
ncbi:MAG: hypothetical protein HYT31_04155 [Parcubacteria group bacterium]|nr:hypothetical protein [Parcubacteria group bacterium]